MRRASRVRVALSGLAALTVGSAVVIGSCARAASDDRPLPTRGDRFLVAGYHTYWTRDAWESYPMDVLDRLYFFEIEAAPDGGVADRHGWPERWTAMLARAGDEGVDVVPTVSMHGATRFEALFTSPEHRSRLIETVMGVLAGTPGLGGVHLDFEAFEPVDPSAREGFTRFATELRSRMRAVDRSWILSSFALALDDHDIYDEAALAEVVDYLVVQGYDFHSVAGPEAGPVAPVTGWGRLTWEHTVERFLELGVEPRKIVMGVPTYGYEWPTESDEAGADTRGEGIEIVLAPAETVVPDFVRAPERAAEHGLRRDLASGTPWYAFRDDQGWRQGWFDDAVSLRLKYRFVRERGLGGVAVFPLAYGDEEVWSGLRRAFSEPRDAWRLPGVSRMMPVHAQTAPGGLAPRRQESHDRRPPA